MLVGEVVPLAYDFITEDRPCRKQRLTLYVFEKTGLSVRQPTPGTL
jgi:hypothetical protein